MKYLLQGAESVKKITMLIEMTSISSEKLIKALHYHFCSGAKVSSAAAAFSVPQPNLTEAIKKLNDVTGKAEKYHEMRLYEKTSINKNIIYSDVWAKVLEDDEILAAKNMTKEEFNRQYLGEFKVSEC